MDVQQRRAFVARADDRKQNRGGLWTQHKARPTCPLPQSICVDSLRVSSSHGKAQKRARVGGKDWTGGSTGGGEV